MTKSIFLALDFGGTKLLVAAFDEHNNIIAQERASTPLDYQAGLNLIIELLIKVSKNYNVKSIGVSAGGPLDYKTGIISPLHCPNWRAVPLKAILEKEFNCPCTIDVDTNAAALAEYVFGCHKSERMLYITISTGMGGGFVTDGKLYRGFNGSHPEVGHQCIKSFSHKETSIKCKCGASDCLEALISGTAIKELYGKSAEFLSKQEWLEIGYNLGQGLRNLSAIYAPDLIVLGGGVALGGGEIFINEAKRVLTENLKIVPKPEVIFTKLNYESALWGAYVLAAKQ